MKTIEQLRTVERQSVKALPLKAQVAVLRALLKNWQGCMRKKNAVRVIITRKMTFTEERIRELVTLLILFDGVWWLVKEELSKRPAAWHQKLFTWAEAVQRGEA